MYKPTARDFFGSMLDAALYHPFADKLRFGRLKVAYWRRFRPKRFASLSRINLGCGPNLLPGFCNVDLVGDVDLRFNFLNRFPLPDAVSDFVYCEHALEHFHIDQVRHVVAECRRIVRPGGVLRISVPRVAAPTQQPREWSVDSMDGSQLVELNRRVFGHEHKSIHSERLLEHLLREVGFAEVRAAKEQQSAFVEQVLIRSIEKRLQGNVVVEARRDV